MASAEPFGGGGDGLGNDANDGGGQWLERAAAAGQEEMGNENINSGDVRQEEVDLRSIEAEDVGDDDALDADLEREFLQQQEAKRLWEEAEEDRRSVGFPPAAQTSTPTTEANDDEDADDGHPLFFSTKFGEVPNRGYRVRVSRQNGGDERLLTLSPGARLEEGVKVDETTLRKLSKPSTPQELLVDQKSHCRELDLDSEFDLPRREANPVTIATTITNGSPSAWNDTMLALFPTAGKFVASANHTNAGRVANGGASGRGGFGQDDDVDKLHAEIFQVTVPTARAVGVEDERPSGSWLRLGLPSNSMKCSTPSGENVRSISSFRRNGGSSSKLSVRTATSLERQYSTGSTSTVESPILLVQERKRSIRPRATRGEPLASAGGGGGRLTFSFPGWDVDISKGEKYPSVVNHNYVDNAPDGAGFGRPPKRLRRDTSPNPSVGTASRGKAVEEDLGDRSPVSEMPDEILLQIMRRLNVQDLCSSVQTCKRWYVVGLQNDLWEHFLGGVDRGMLSDSSSDCLPRWVCKKNVSLSETIRLRFNLKAPAFSKAYDNLRRALHAWWNSGLLSSRYSSKIMYSLVRKMTMNDWSLLYEALGTAFIDRADRIANTLKRKLKPVAYPTGGTASKLNPSEKRDSDVDIGSLVVLYENPKGSYIRSGSSSEFEVHWKSGSIKEVSEEEGAVGKELWESLLVLWQKYKGWLHLVSTHCPDLNREVNIERARGPNQPATPTVYNKGLICFRSQVVLRYGLRNVLQAGFSYLTTQDARDTTSDQDMDLLRSSHHMLQELDVADDLTLPPKNHTQTKLRQCFRSALSTNSKLALHMNDRLNHL